jgi:hypothetical protein
MRIYLEPAAPPERARPKKSGSGLQGVRRIDFLEQVVVNLWVDNGQSLAGDSSPEPAAPEAQGSNNVIAMTPPPAGLAALTGNLSTAAYTARLLNRALIQIETRGPFFYDAEKSLARFDVVPQSDPNLPNDVRTTKVPPRSGTSTLFSQVLELDLNGGATTANRPHNSPAINRIHAWTYTPGRLVTVASLDDASEAYGQDLVHERAAGRTVLVGAPLHVVRERNVLTAGSPQVSATLTSEPVPGTGPERKSQIKVLGPGRIDLFDNAANAPGPTAVWLTSMVQTKETVNGRDQDLYTFTDRAMFEDKKADYWLKGNILKLWLEARPDPKSVEGKPVVGPPDPAPAPGASPKPSRIQAIGAVTSHSTDFDVEEASLLNAFFSDAKPAQVAVAPAPQPATPAAPPPGRSSGGVGEPRQTQPAPVPMVAGAEPQPEPEPPKPPYKIRAKVIDAWVHRVPVTNPPRPGDRKGGAPGTATGTAPKEAPGKGGQEPATVKYQLDRARCEENVTVHQDPTEPSKVRGVDILGRLLIIDGSPEGNIMTVFGWPNRPGEVHQEDTSLIGPEVKLDQIHNSAFVKGRGALTMPTNSDLSGSELSQPEVVVIHWRDKMDFRGAARFAEFEGKVSARQGESWVLCNTMHVTFDRPVYFNQSQKKAAPPPKKDPKNPKKKNPSGAKGAKDEDDEDKPKIETVKCYPAAGDAADDRTELYVTYNQVEFDPTGKMIKSQRLVAQELRMFAQAQDPGGGEKYQQVEADGPGVLRIWQMGDRDPAGPNPNGNGNRQPQPAQPKAPMQPGARPANEDDQEMKLTVVNFRGRMIAIDKNKVFQKATFRDNITVVNVPADSPTLEIQRHKLPPRAQLLTCTRELIVWTHKKPNAPTVQRMDARGNAYMRTDEYDGWGEIISHDGQVVILTGSEVLPARVMNRFNRANEQAGKRIIYDRANGAIRVIESLGGTLGGSK